MKSLEAALSNFRSNTCDRINGGQNLNFVRDIGVRPQGGTSTGIRMHNIMKPYLAKLETEMAAGKEMKPFDLIVLTDGMPSDDVESVLISPAKKLDKLNALPYQVSVQSFQVGNEEGAGEAPEELDNGLSELVEGGVRDSFITRLLIEMSRWSISAFVYKDSCPSMQPSPVLRRAARELAL